MAQINSGNFDPLVIGAKTAGKFILLVQNLLETLYDGIIPPILGYSRMDKLLESAYARDDMYSSTKHNKSGFYLWEIEATDDYMLKGKHFMVLSAGGGREVIALIRKGIHVDAWECNARLLEYGNSLLQMEGLNSYINKVEPNKFPIIPKNNYYDFCIIGWSAYCHILRKQDRINILNQARKVVKGPVLISFPRKKHISKLKKFLRDIVSSFPGASKGIDYDLVINQNNTICVGFDKNKISEEAAEAGLFLKFFKDHSPEYPYALLTPKE